MDEKLQKRKENHDSSARSKAPKAKPTIKPKIVPGQIVYARSEGSKHEARDPLLVTEVLDGKVKVMKVLHTHSNSSKLPKISSEKILADEKFLYIPPHKRSGSLTKQRSSDDSWWRDSPPQTKNHPTNPTPKQWTPNIRLEEDDDDTYEVSTEENANILEDDLVGDERINIEHVDNEDDLLGDERIDIELDDNQNVPQDINLFDGAERADENDSEPTDNENEDVEEEIERAESTVSEETTEEDIPNDPVIDQHRRPRKGDSLQVVINDYWVTIKLTSNENRMYPHYYNCRLKDNTQDGLYLRPGGSWTFVLPGTVEDAEEEQEIVRHEIQVAALDLIITPATSDHSGSRDFMDEEYSDQDSIFGTSHIEYLTNSVSSALNAARHEAFSNSLENTIQADTGRAFSLIQNFNIELPRSGYFQPNRVYTIPPEWRLFSQDIARSRIISASMPEIDEAVSAENPQRRSAWMRRIGRLRRFLDRAVRNPFSRWR